MTSIYNLLKIVLIVSLFIVIYISNVFGREITVINQKYTAQLIVTSTPWPYKLSDKIQEGFLFLKKTPPLTYETKTARLKNGKLIKTNELVRKQIDFAVLNTISGEIFEKKSWVKEVDIKNYRKTGALSLTSADNVQIDIQPKLWNSFNSFYEVVGHPEMAVIANKYLIASNLLGNLPEKSKLNYSEIIYSPYSLALHQPEIIQAGKDYLEKNTNSAFEGLNKSYVKSKSVAGQMATSVVSKDFVKNIILVEHVDPDSFAMATDGGKELIERILTIIGTNQDHAYRYTGSPAGASGMAQFIKPTYQTIVAKYPEAGLIKDYNLGMADHSNAIKAMVLFFDLYSKDITGKIIKPEIIRQLGITEEMMAAAYNGGPNRVVSSVNKYGLAWLSQQFNLPKTQRIFRTETLQYLNKFRSISKLDIF